MVRMRQPVWIQATLSVFWQTGRAGFSQPLSQGQGARVLRVGDLHRGPASRKSRRLGLRGVLDHSEMFPAPLLVTN